MVFVTWRCLSRRGLGGMRGSCEKVLETRDQTILEEILQDTVS